MALIKKTDSSLKIVMDTFNGYQLSVQYIHIEKQVEINKLGSIYNSPLLPSLHLPDCNTGTKFLNN